MPGRMRWSFTIALFVVAALVAGGVLLARPPVQTRDVAVPADDAEPREVLTAYLDALDAHDCETAVALTVGDERESASGWCDDVARIDDVELDREIGADDPDRRSAGIVATFHLRYRLFHNDVSMNTGPQTVWGWQLERTSTSAPWRIVSEGMG